MNTQSRFEFKRDVKDLDKNSEICSNYDKFDSRFEYAISQYRFLRFINDEDDLLFFSR